MQNDRIAPVLLARGANILKYFSRSIDNLPRLWYTDYTSCRGLFFCAYWDRHSPGVREVFKTGLPEFYQEVPKK